MVTYIFYSQYRIYSDNYIQANEKFPLGSAAPHNDRLYTVQFLSQRRYLHIRDAAQALPRSKLPPNYRESRASATDCFYTLKAFRVCSDRLNVSLAKEVLSLVFASAQELSRLKKSMSSFCYARV